MTVELLLALHEGVRYKPYRCPAGKLTIGYGRNLEDTGITEGEAMYLLTGDVERIEDELDRRIPWWKKLNDARRAVLVDMAYNLGVAGLMTFKRTLRYAEAGNYVTASMEMLNSRWAKHVGSRAERLAEMMRSGEWPQELRGTNETS